VELASIRISRIQFLCHTRENEDPTFELARMREVIVGTTTINQFLDSRLRGNDNGGKKWAF